jgi:hypothetical protein
VKRDLRLLFAIIAFGASFVAVWIQADITAEYVFAADLRQVEQRTGFGFMGSEAPSELCFVSCAGGLSTAAGLVGLLFFWIGLILVTYAWWKPKNK